MQRLTGRVIRLGAALAALGAIAIGARADDIVLEPGGPTETATLNGTVGLTGLSFNTDNSSYRAFGAGFSAQGPLAADGGFSATVGADLRYSVDTTQYYPAEQTWFYTYDRNRPSLAPDGSETVDRRQGTAQVVVLPSVVGGTANGLSTSTYARVTGTDGDYVDYRSNGGVYNASAVNRTLPVAALAGTQISASASILLPGGCTVSVSSNTTVDLSGAAGGTVPVVLPFDVSSQSCDGDVDGVAQLDGLTALGLTPSSFRLRLSGPRSSSRNVTSGAAYPTITGLPAGTYTPRFEVFFPGTTGYFYSPNLPALEIPDSGTLSRDFVSDVGLVSGSLSFDGPWGPDDGFSFQVYANAVAGGFSRGSYDATAQTWTAPGPSGDTRLSYIRGSSFTCTNPSCTGQIRETPILWFTETGATTTVTVPQGGTVAAEPRSVTTGQAQPVTLTIANPGGLPDDERVRFSEIRVYGTGVTEDAVTGERYRSQIDYYERFPEPTFTESPLFRGYTGLYELTASAQGTDGRTYSATFTVDLRESQQTPAGTDVVVVTDEGVTFDFDSVDVAGETVVNRSTATVAPPSGFAFFDFTGADFEILDISTTAEFSGDVELCFTYDDTEIPAGLEPFIQLVHFTDGAWEFITSPGSPDTASNEICGITDSFSPFAVVFPDPTDTDGDGVRDFDDNCVDVVNPSQEDRDGDGEGDACEPDVDGDGLDDGVDNCPDIPNPAQEDLDLDGLGDACDPDQDGDLVEDVLDNCPRLANAGQEDLDGDGEGDVCDLDDDGDEVPDLDDNCALDANTDQLDADGDGAGDVCDDDDDDDGVLDDFDNCRIDANPAQEDLDGDGTGDACDTDADGDEVEDDVDNCVGLTNPDQADFDGDSLGDACDADADDDGIDDSVDVCAETPLDEAIDVDGCASAQLFELSCPVDGRYRWRGAYVSCVAREATRQVHDGLLTRSERREILREAVRSGIGSRRCGPIRRILRALRGLEDCRAD